MHCAAFLSLFDNFLLLAACRSCFCPHTLLCSFSLSSRVCVCLSREEKQVALVRKWVWLALQVTLHFLFFFPPSKVPPAVIWHVRGRRCFSHKNKVVKCAAGHLRFNTASVLTLPRLPTGEDRKIEKKKWKMPLFFWFLHSGSGGCMGANPSCHGAKAAFHPGHGASLSQGHAERQTPALMHTEGQFRGGSDLWPPPCVKISK